MTSAVPTGRGGGVGLPGRAGPSLPPWLQEAGLGLPWFRWMHPHLCSLDLSPPVPQLQEALRRPRAVGGEHGFPSLSRVGLIRPRGCGEAHGPGCLEAHVRLWVVQGVLL